jgi:hypothetical protein
LPAIVPVFLAIWINLVGLVIYPICYDAASVEFGGIIANAVSDPQRSLHIFAIVSHLPYILIYSDVIVPTLLFRPTWLQTVTSLPINICE